MTVRYWKAFDDRGGMVRKVYAEAEARDLQKQDYSVHEYVRHYNGGENELDSLSL